MPIRSDHIMAALQAFRNESGRTANGNRTRTLYHGAVRLGIGERSSETEKPPPKENRQNNSEDLVKWKATCHFPSWAGRYPIPHPMNAPGSLAQPSPPFELADFRSACLAAFSKFKVAASSSFLKDYSGSLPYHNHASCAPVRRKGNCASCSPLSITRNPLADGKTVRPFPGKLTYLPLVASAIHPQYLWLAWSSVHHVRKTCEHILATRVLTGIIPRAPRPLFLARRNKGSPRMSLHGWFRAASAEGNQAQRAQRDFLGIE